MKILVLEPYYGGSHKNFLKNLTKHVAFDFTLLTLPARKWKWRMRLSAPYYAEQLTQFGKFDRVLCSSFVDVATLRGLGPRWLNDVPVLTYFHENQFAYPVQVEDERDSHFALTNVTTALASDSIAFNSCYNRDTFIAGAEKLLKKNGDMQFADFRKNILRKSVVLYPGVDFTLIDQTKEYIADQDAPVIMWNHRWEHDKNPDRFFNALFKLDKMKAKYSLVVAGQSFATKPAIFAESKKRLTNRVLHFGYLPSRKEYVQWLQRADHIVSTATHEFFGISVIEAVRAGCRPLLPKRLSYKELFPADFLYNEEEFVDSLDTVLQKERLQPQEAMQLTDHFSWNKLAPKYQKWLAC